MTVYFFFFNDTATTEIYTLSLHDALPISIDLRRASPARGGTDRPVCALWRSEEHTSELQSQSNLVCRLLLEKKKKKNATIPIQTQYEISVNTNSPPYILPSYIQYTTIHNL